VRYQVTKYFPLANSKDRLLRVESEPCVAHVGECFCEIGQVILFVFAGNDNVIHVGENVVAYLAFEDPLGEVGKGGSGILESLCILTKKYVPKGVMKLVLALSCSFM
jgi:hypothetical protein